MFEALRRKWPALYNMRSLAQNAAEGEARLKLFRVGEPLSLSGVLPMLSSMGVEVVDERPYELTGLDRRSFVYEFGLRYGGELVEDVRVDEVPLYEPAGEGELL